MTVSDEPRGEQVTGRPATRLRPFVESYAGYHVTGLAPGIHAGLPSRSLTLIVAFDEPLDLVVMPDPAQPADRLVALVGGLHAAPATIRHNGTQHGVQLELTPAGARALLGLPPAALASLVVPLDAVLPRAGELVDRLSTTPDWPGRFAVLDEVLGASLADPPPLPAEVTRAWSVLCGTAGSVTVTDLAEHVGWSRRHLTARFRSEYGLTPKVVGRVLRFQRANELLLADAPPSLADVAARCGYADQAHLTRDWKELAGATPTEWLADELRMTYSEGATPEAAEDATVD